MRVKACAIVGSIVLAGLHPSVNAQEADLEGWRQTRWGMSQAEVVEALKSEFDASQIKQVRESLMVLENAAIESANYKVDFAFDANQLRAVTLVTWSPGATGPQRMSTSNASLFQGLVQTFTGSYGAPLPKPAPTPARAPVYGPAASRELRLPPGESRGGAQPVHEWAEWHLKTTWIKVELFGPSPDANVASIIYNRARPTP